MKMFILIFCVLFLCSCSSKSESEYEIKNKEFSSFTYNMKEMCYPINGKEYKFLYRSLGASPFTQLFENTQDGIRAVECK